MLGRALRRRTLGPTSWAARSSRAGRPWRRPWRRRAVPADRAGDRAVTHGHRKPDFAALPLSIAGVQSGH